MDVKFKILIEYIMKNELNQLGMMKGAKMFRDGFLE